MCGKICVMILSGGSKNTTRQGHLECRVCMHAFSDHKMPFVVDDGWRYVCSLTKLKAVSRQVCSSDVYSLVDGGTVCESVHVDL